MERLSVRMCLKQIESLSYDMETSDTLKQLCKDLQDVLNKHSAAVPKEQGLIIRPKVTSSSERARKLKHKYKRLGKQVALYKPLPTSQPGRHRLNAAFRNRVGRKAAKLRAVRNVSSYHA